MVTTTLVIIGLVAVILFWPTDTPANRLERLLRAWRRKG